MTIKHTATGYSRRPRNDEVRSLLLQKSSEITYRLKASKIEEATRWYQYLIPKCPLQLWTLDGNAVETSAQLMQEEVKTQTGIASAGTWPTKSPSVER